MPSPPLFHVLPFPPLKLHPPPLLVFSVVIPGVVPMLLSIAIPGVFSVQPTFSIPQHSLHPFRSTINISRDHIVAVNLWVDGREGSLVAIKMAVQDALARLSGSHSLEAIAARPDSKPGS